MFLVVASDNHLFQFVWKNICAHKVTDEGQHIPWVLDLDDCNWQHTHKVSNSGWIAGLAEGNGFLACKYPSLQHFVVATSDYWVEILAEDEPEISELTQPDKVSVPCHSDVLDLINTASVILIFCAPTVDPAFVTQTLKVEPTTLLRWARLVIMFGIVNHTFPMLGNGSSSCQGSKSKLPSKDDLNAG